MKWYEVFIKANKEIEELIIDILEEFDHHGFAIDDNTIDDSVSYDYIDESLIERDYILIKVYFDVETNIAKVIEEIKKKLNLFLDLSNQAKIEISYSFTEEDQWINEWKKYHKPIVIGNIIISTSWEREINDLTNEKIIVKIDPGIAFGTGSHPTTLMCIEALQKYFKKGMDVIDVGTGSGILSIVAKKLGAERVVAIDIDETATNVAKYNAKLNDVDIKVLKNNLIEGIKDKFDIVIANIIAEVIVDLTSNVKAILKNNGIYIVSGILPEKAYSVIESLENNLFKILEIREKENWCSIVATI